MGRSKQDLANLDEVSILISMYDRRVLGCDGRRLDGRLRASYVLLAGVGGVKGNFLLLYFLLRYRTRDRKRNVNFVS